MADKEVQMKSAASSGSSGAKKVNPPQKTPQKEKTDESSAKSSGSLKKSPQQKESVDKEVLLILRELNSKLNAQEARLQKQEQKLEEIGAGLNKGYDEYGYDYYEPQNDANYVAEPLVEDTEYIDYQGDETSSFAPSESVSKYKQMAEKITSKEVVDNEVNDDFASFVNASFREGLTIPKMNEMMNDIHRPQNCDSLVKTSVNNRIWKLLRTSSRSDDERMQTIQNNMVKAACNFVKLVDKNSDKFDNQDMEWGMHGVALLGNANKLINNRRKDLHKLDMDPKYYYLASSNMPYTDLLYGEDGDVNKNIRDIQDISRIGRSFGNNYAAYSRGMNRGGRRPHPYNRGGAPRGRGRRGSWGGPPKNQQVVPKK